MASAAATRARRCAPTSKSRPEHIAYAALHGLCLTGEADRNELKRMVGELGIDTGNASNPQFDLPHGRRGAEQLDLGAARGRGGVPQIRSIACRQRPRRRDTPGTSPGAARPRRLAARSRGEQIPAHRDPLSDAPPDAASASGLIPVPASVRQRSDRSGTTGMAIHRRRSRSYSARAAGSLSRSRTAITICISSFARYDPLRSGWKVRASRRQASMISSDPAAGSTWSSRYTSRSGE